MTPGQSFKTAGVDNIRSKGVITLTFQIANIHCRAAFHVFERLSQEIILGRCFLHAHRATINFDKNTLDFDKSATIVSTQCHVIEPHSICLLQARCMADRVFFPTGLNGRVTDEHNSDGLYVHGSLSTICKNKVPVLVQNTSHRQLLVKKGGKLSKFCPLFEDECCCF